MVSMSESLLYYCTVPLIALILLIDASCAINESAFEMSSSTQRAKFSPLQNREKNFLKNQKSNKSNEFGSFIRYGLDTESEFLSLSSSGRVDNIDAKNGGTDEENSTDDEKTLSQQVADGKYGLIQDEIFTVKPSRLGVLSYDTNPEVPRDNVNNLGGLEPDDIWLAENHLLVLAGNSFNDLRNEWRPIDDYTAPLRPVQIPPNPKVPPPFPVQLTDNGPVEYVKSNHAQLRRPFKPVYNPMLISYNKSQTLYSKIPYYGFNVTPPKGQFRPPMVSFPPSVYEKPPPGAEFIPPYLTNVSSSEMDEGDPSLHYPPPYDFYYPKDNTTKVPPGPLVPGIILPPPVNFFSPLINDSHVSPHLKSSKLKSGKQFHFPAENPSFIAYNDIINDIPYPNLNNVKVSLKTDNIDDEWIPIPAPKPFYITGEKKPLTGAISETNEPTSLFKISPQKPSFRYLQHADPPLVNELFYTTTSNPQLLDDTLSPPRSDSYSTPLAEPNIKATFYFYEEPQDADVAPLKTPISTTARPLPSHVNVDNNIPYHYPTPDNHIGARKRKPIPIIPIYYLAELENSMEVVKPTDVSYLDVTRSPKLEYFTNTDLPVYSMSKPDENRTPEPIFKYNYLSTDYNRKPISDTTDAPFIDYNSNQLFPRHYYHMPEFETIAAFPKSELYEQTTPSPIPLLHYSSYNSFEYPWLPMFGYYPQFPHPTENPYDAYFTKEEGDLVDDRTKTYFTIFGQKLGQNVESTTPLSAASSINPTWVHSDQKQSYRSRPSQSFATSSSSSYYIGHSEESSEASTKPPSLEGDTLVNYLTPNPTLEPDAEYVKPITKYIRPIVVEDLAANLNERLNNIMNLQAIRKNPTFPRSRFRYTLVDHKLNYSPNRNTRGKHYTSDVEHVDVPTPVPLHGDVRINYRYSPQLAIDPQAEYVSATNAEQRSRKTQNLGSSIGKNMLANYKNSNHYTAVNDDTEYNIDSREGSSRKNDRYPEIEHDHFYFLFPGETNLNHIENEQRDLQSDAEKRGRLFKRKLRDKGTK